MTRPPASALRAHREVARERYRRAGERDVGVVLPHLAASPGVARGFAAGVAGRLEGGLLPMSDRQQLLDHAETMGLRRFEANLLIAAVQHNAVPLKLAGHPLRRDGDGQPADPKPRGWLARWWLPVAVALAVEAIVLGWWFSS